MKNKQKKLLYTLLLSLLTIKISGCSYETNQDNSTAEIISEEDLFKLKSLKNIEEPLVVNRTPEYISKTLLSEKRQFKQFLEVPSVIAHENVNIRKAPNLGADLAGKLVEGQTLELLEELNNGWYKVLYYEEECYLSSDYTSKTITYKVNGDIKKIFYAKDTIDIVIPAEISVSGFEEYATIPSLECLEVYNETENQYLVQTSDFIGFIDKNSPLEELVGTFVVVDISDQKLKLYENNKIILETPVVTGKTSTPSDEGLFQIYKYKKNDYLIGPGYKSYIDIMMFYNRGEGLHDSEINYCENGKQNNHGWRRPEEFGGNTYINHGSHGCVNMLNDAVFEVYEHTSIGTKVLVKK